MRLADFWNQADAPATELRWQLPRSDLDLIVAGLQAGAHYRVTVDPAPNGPLPFDVTVIADEAGEAVASTAGVISTSPIAR